MSGNAEQVAEVVAADVSAAIDSANERAEERADIAEAIIDGAMETERARHVRDLERDVDECLNNQREMAEAMTNLSLTVAQMQGQLTAMSPPPLMTLPESEKADGRKEDHVQNVTVEVEAQEPEAEAPEAPAPAPETPPPRRKRRFL